MKMFAENDKRGTADIQPSKTTFYGFYAAVNPLFPLYYLLEMNKINISLSLGLSVCCVCMCLPLQK